ncbi:ankyrin repeat domain-containing protein [Neobacillus novalis]|uniref:Ankyrin repeat domain-containing protein n=1 Tax=Neobacillus novalis TaxID=220687 RepID=A0AA95MJU3_9BACI|nr:ankyrin repeat domain-containing protein [Neobacillus novalis]WHY84890.1 ankyrin repeat domain-containing protein [Neobacillus novalis]
MKKTKWLVLIGIILVIVFAILLINKAGWFQGKSEEEKQNDIISAIDNNDTNKINKFIKNKYPLNFISNEGFTPFETALNDRSLESAILLLENGAKINDKSSTPLFVQIVANMYDYQVSEEGPEYQKELNSYKTLLKIASKNKLNNINATNELGNTTLHIAALKGHPEIIKYIIGLGSEPTGRNKAKETPLLIAAKAGNLEAVQLLYQYHNENLDKDNEGNNIFYSAAMNGRKDIVDNLLLESKEGLNDKNAVGKTALIIAAEYGYTDIVKMLLNNGADPSLKSSEGKTALEYALHWNHEEIIKLLK